MEIDHEKAVLCAVLESKEKFLELLPRLAPSDFAEKRHRSLWRGLQSLFKESGRADAVRVKELVDSGKVECDLEYVRALRRYVPDELGWYSVGDAHEWADKVEERSRLRRVREGLSRVLRESEGDSAKPEQLASDAMSVVLSLDQRDLGGFAPLSEGFDEFEELLGNLLEGRFQDIREPTGFRDLDDVLGGGLPKGNLTVIGARPGVFKTAIGWKIAQNVAERLQGEGRGCVAFASLEMSREELLARAVSADGRVVYSDMVQGKLSARQKKRVLTALECHRALAPYIQVYDGVATSDFLRYQTLLMMVRNDVRLLVIDFAEMVADEGPSELERVSGIFLAARRLAKERNIPVVLLSQLNRQVEYEPSRMPEIHHLKLSGEAAAAVVLLLYYPYKYEKNGERVQVPESLVYQRVDEYDSATVRQAKQLANKGRLYVKVGKSRFGGNIIVTLNVVPEWLWLGDYEPESEKGGVVKLVARETGAEDMNDF